MKNITGRILVPGGVLSPGELRKIVNTAHYYNTDSISFGSRQEIILNINEKFINEVKTRLHSGQYEFTTDKSLQNITTSFVSRNVFHSTSWVTEGAYLEILSMFKKQPTLKINIVDPQQSFVSLFSGQLNFVASPYDDYWFLFVNLNESKPYLWPVLVDGAEIAALCEEIENLVLKNGVDISPVKIETYIYHSKTWNFRIIDKPLSVPAYRFQNYEGFHPMGQKFWLGIYQRDNLFPVNFLENLCILCSQSNIGSIIITPWNSILIKNIEEKDLTHWENLLGQFGINTGHSHLELNWKLPDLDKSSFDLKNYIFERFEKIGLRTEGVTFGVALENERKDPDTTIIIRKKNLGSLPSFLPFLSTYSVSYRKNFDPASNEVISFADGLKRRNLPDILAYLCNLYYKSLGTPVELVATPIQETKGKEIVHDVYQCQSCFTVYDPKAGDDLMNIVPGTEFEKLPTGYKCSLCESSKDEFKKVQLETAVKSS